MKPATIQCIKDLPAERDRKHQKAQGNEEQRYLDKHEQQPGERDVLEESNALHRADSGPNDHPEKLRDHEHRETAGLHRTMPRSGQRIGHVRPYTIHA